LWFTLVLVSRTGRFIIILRFFVTLRVKFGFLTGLRLVFGLDSKVIRVIVWLHVTRVINWSFTLSVASNINKFGWLIRWRHCVIRLNCFKFLGLVMLTIVVFGHELSSHQSSVSRIGHVARCWLN